ncbi:MAG: response regulator [Myxococcales bacterium]|jgi:DNA-binding response OmpR family regulator
MGDGEGPKKQLGRILLAQRVVTQDELQEMLDEQQREPGERLASTATRSGRLSAMEALRALAEQHGVPPVDLTAIVVPLSLLKLVPVEMAREHVVFPLRIDGDALLLAMASPDAEDSIEELSFVTAKTIKPHVALDYAIRHVIEYAYAAQERGEEYYVGPFVTEAALGELGLPDLPRAPEPPSESGRPPPAGESGPVQPGADGGRPSDGELFPGQESRSLSDAPPLDDAFAEAPRPSQPPRMPALDADARVLLADADEQTRALLRGALQETGVAVLESGDGVHALEQVRDQSPRVLVIDADLPSVHGFDICRRLKGSQRFSGIPIVVIGTRLDDWRVQLDLQEAYGVRHVFAKPLDAIKVTRTVRLLLDGQTVDDELPPLSTTAEQCWVQAMEAFERGELDGAIEALERGVREEGDVFELNYHLGLLYGRRDDLFAAIDSLENAVRAQPHHFSSLKNLAVVYQRAGFRHKALDVWERALSAAPDEDTRINIREHMVSLL